jgi:hypothetical protein
VPDAYSDEQKGDDSRHDAVCLSPKQMSPCKCDPIRRELTVAGN